MATTYQDTTGNGSNKVFNFGFPYLKDADVKVQINQVQIASTEYAVSTGPTKITFNNNSINSAVQETDGSPKTGLNVRVYRDTEVDAAKAVFASGSSIRATDLNNNQDQALYAAQEQQNLTVAKWQISADAIDGTKIGDDSIDSEHIVDGSIDTAHIADDQVTNAKLADAAVSSAQIAGDAINSEHYAAGSIDTEHIADLNVTTAKIAADAITNAKLADNAVGAENIAEPSISTAKINNLAVTTGKIAADAVDGTKIADNAIDSEHYTDGSIDAEHIADAQVTNAKLAADAVTGAKIADGSVDTEHLAADAVTTAKIVANAVTATQIADNAVTNTKLADNAVGTAEILDNAVTNVKLADNAVHTAELVDNAVTNVKLADNAVHTAELVDNAVTNAKVADNAIHTAELVNDAVTGAKIADDSIDSEHIANLAIDTAHIADAQITTAKIAAEAVTTAKIADAELVTLAGMQSGTASILAASTTLAATLAEINAVCDGMGNESTITDSDLKYPTSGAVVDYVAAQIAPIGGLEVIATDAAFPNTQPAAGVVISIADAGGLVVNGSGVSTTGRTVGGSTVTIEGINSQFNSTTIDAGVAMMVSSTGAAQTYTYHKATLKEADLLSLSGDINDFAERYRVAGSAPSSSLDEGDLWWDTATDKLKVYDGSGWEEVASSGDFYINTISSYSGTGGNSATFNGSAYRFVLSNPGTTAQQHIVSINGVIQKPNSGTSQPSEGFVIDGSSIIFSNAPASGSAYFILTLGTTVSIGTPSDNTVATAKIQNLAVTTAKIAADAIDNTKLADNAVGAENLAEPSVTTAKISDSNVTTAKIAADAITGAKIADSSIDSEHYVDGSIDAEHIGNAQVTNAKLAIDAVTGPKIADDSIDSEHLAAGSIDLEHMSSESVDEDNLHISNAGSNGQFLSKQSGNTGGLTWATVSTTDSSKMPLAGGTFTGDVVFDNQSNAGRDIVWDESADALEFLDSTKAIFGTGDDLQIYHDGSHSYIDNTGTGNLYLKDAGAIKVRTASFGVDNADGSEAMIAAAADGAVELYHDNVKKVETTSYGIGVTGTCFATSDFQLDDGCAYKVGTGDDLQIYHSSGQNYITSSNGRINLRASEVRCEKSDGSEVLAKFIEDGACELRYNDSIKFKTTSGGAQVTGNMVADAFYLGDGEKLYCGSGDDLEIYHSGTYGFLENKTGNFYFRNDGGTTYFQMGTGDESAMTLSKDAGVELYYDNVAKFRTTSEGVYGRGCAHAYGRLDHTGGVHLDEDFGCGAVTDNGTGNYTVALTIALQNNNDMNGFINCHPVDTSNQKFGFGAVETDSTTAVTLSLRLCDNDAASLGVDDWDNVTFVIFDVG